MQTTEKNKICFNGFLFVSLVFVLFCSSIMETWWSAVLCSCFVFVFGGIKCKQDQENFSFSIVFKPIFIVWWSAVQCSAFWGYPSWWSDGNTQECVADRGKINLYFWSWLVLSVVIIVKTHAHALTHSLSLSLSLTHTHTHTNIYLFFVKW